MFAFFYTFHFDNLYFHGLLGKSFLPNFIESHKIFGTFDYNKKNENTLFITFSILLIIIPSIYYDNDDFTTRILLFDCIDSNCLNVQHILDYKIFFPYNGDEEAKYRI